MESAQTVQALLLNQAMPAEMEAVCLPASEVGGDFYQVVELADGARLVMVGDVSGKGLKAAMLVAVVVGAVGSTKSSAPAAVLARVNRALMGRAGGGFATACCARFDLDGTVTIANAGHLSPYCDGSEVELEAGLPLGIVAEAEYAETVVRGERFTFVSDGVVEAENAQRELFGFERTREISTQSAQEIAEAAKAWGQNDDITVVTVRRNGA
jgi:serine phosphatase RsbU (regulator of sigma subunit)